MIDEIGVNEYIMKIGTNEYIGFFFLFLTKRILFLFYLQAIVSIPEVRTLFQGPGGYGRYTVGQCLANISQPSTDDFMKDSGEIRVPMVHSGAAVYRGMKPQHINVQKAYRMVYEWIDAVVKPLLGHWRQMRPTWYIKRAEGILYEECCYGVTEMKPSTIEIRIDTRAHTGYSELLATIIHEVSHALTMHETAEHGKAWFNTTLSLIVATRMWLT